MCGIVAYLGTSEARSILLAGLAHLEYRGYDSAGLATLQPLEPTPPLSLHEDATVEAATDVKRRKASAAGSGYRLNVVKAAGKVKNLSSSCTIATKDTLGIAHTRWATHGPPTDENAHPHSSFDGSLCVVHNGIVENFKELRTQLQRKGYVMVSCRPGVPKY